MQRLFFAERAERCTAAQHCMQSVPWQCEGFCIPRFDVPGAVLLPVTYTS